MGVCARPARHAALINKARLVSIVPLYNPHERYIKRVSGSTIMNCIRFVAIIVGVASMTSAQVRVWQSTLTLPVYEEGPPDVNPPFDAFSTGRYNYPYTLR